VVACAFRAHPPGDSDLLRPGFRGIRRLLGELLRGDLQRATLPVLLTGKAPYDEFVNAGWKLAQLADWQLTYLCDEQSRARGVVL
jgi:hypothetical protein